MSDEKTITTVSMKPETKERLGKFGTVNDTFDDVLNKLMDEVDKVKK